MEFVIGQEVTKDIYTEAAIWCNNGGVAHIEAKDGKYFIVENAKPTEEEIAVQKRSQRDAYLQDTDKYMLADFPVTEEEKVKVVEYRTYLRDLPTDAKWPNVEVKSFEEWKA